MCSLTDTPKDSTWNTLYWVDLMEYCYKLQNFSRFLLNFLYISVELYYKGVAEE